MRAISAVAWLIAAYGLLGPTATQAADPPAADTPTAASKADAAPAQAAPGATDSAPSTAARDNAGVPPAVKETSTADSKAADAAPAAGQANDPLTAAVIDDSQLREARGGETVVDTSVNLNQNTSNGTVSGNVATNLTTGSNNISDSAFSNSAGIPIVIQNTGNNVLIQNSTILNLQLAAPK